MWTKNVNTHDTIPFYWFRRGQSGLSPAPCSRHIWFLLNLFQPGGRSRTVSGPPALNLSFEKICWFGNKPIQNGGPVWPGFCAGSPQKRRFWLGWGTEWIQVPYGFRFSLKSWFSSLLYRHFGLRCGIFLFLHAAFLSIIFLSGGVVGLHQPYQNLER